MTENTKDTSKQNNLGISQRQIIQSSTLFGDQREILIQHGQQTYQLKITRQDKLILTK